MNLHVARQVVLLGECQTAQLTFVWTNAYNHHKLISKQGHTVTAAQCKLQHAAVEVASCLCYFPCSVSSTTDLTISTGPQYPGLF